MKAFWNERYDTGEYVYGTKPNEFFKEKLDGLKPGEILLPAEGEGRNTVYAAINGWNVFAFDQSNIAKQKAEKLANKHKVSITYEVCELESFTAQKNFFDCIALIYVHILPDIRKAFHHKLIDLLKPGGNLILEAFDKSQIANNTGGPKNQDMLFSKEEVFKDFHSLVDLKIAEEEVHLKEGSYHNGSAKIIRLTGTKLK